MDASKVDTPDHWPGNCLSLSLRIHRVKTCASIGCLGSSFPPPTQPEIIIRIQRSTSFSLQCSEVFIQYLRLDRFTRSLCGLTVARKIHHRLSICPLVLCYRSPGHLCSEPGDLVSDGLHDNCAIDTDVYENGLYVEEQCPEVNRTDSGRCGDMVRERESGHMLSGK